MSGSHVKGDTGYTEKLSLILLFNSFENNFPKWIRLCSPGTKSVSFKFSRDDREEQKKN